MPMAPSVGGNAALRPTTSRRLPSMPLGMHVRIPRGTLYFTDSGPERGAGTEQEKQ